MLITNKYMSYWFRESSIEEEYNLRTSSLKEAKANGTNLNVVKRPVRRLEKRQYIIIRI